MRELKKFKLFRDADGEDVFIKFQEGYDDEDAENRYLKNLQRGGYYSEEDIAEVKTEIWVERV